MDIIKTPEGWINIQTGDCIPYGQIVVNLYNRIRFIDDDLHRKLKEYFAINANWFHIIGVKDGEAVSDDINAFENHPDIIAIIKSDQYMTANRAPIKYVVSKEAFYYGGKTLYYIPIYESDIQKIFKNADLIRSNLIQQQTRSRFVFLVEFLCLHEEHAFYKPQELQNTIMESIDSWLEDAPIETRLCKYNNEYYRKFVIENNDINQLLYDDLIEIMNTKDYLVDCHKCQKAFLSKDKRRRFCSECSKDQKAIKQHYDKERKTSLEYEHKKIRDMIKNRTCRSPEEETLKEKILINFTNESQYYLDVINRKEIEPNVDYDTSINTARAYKEWIHKKRAEYKDMFKSISHS